MSIAIGSATPISIRPSFCWPAKSLKCLPGQGCERDRKVAKRRPNMSRRRMAGNCCRLSGAGTRFIWGHQTQMRLIQKRAAITTAIYGNCRPSKWNHNRTELQNLKSTLPQERNLFRQQGKQKSLNKLGLR